MENIRVRFAPSPTGTLHIGGARTALFNWLYARGHKGKFVLRLEDTDLNRSTEESAQGIIEGLSWLGLDWDEGPDIGGPYGPYRQSERWSIYQKYLELLLAEKKAYYCFCSPDEIDRQRKIAQENKQNYRYSGACQLLKPEEVKKRLAQGDKPVVRLHVPQEGKTNFNDLVRGRVEFANDLLDDFIIAKADGWPTYNFAVVVDDFSMKITHVIRAEEHLSNTPKQVLIYNALDLPLPHFAHVSMILAPDRSKLSKRHGATSVQEFREEGYLPESLLNYLALLGWSPGTDQDLMSVEEMINCFDLNHLSRSAAIYDVKKLAWMNGHYLANANLDSIIGLVENEARHRGWWQTDKLPYLRKVVDLVRSRVKTVKDILDDSGYFFEEVTNYDGKGINKYFRSPDSLEKLQAILDVVLETQDFTAPALEEALRQSANNMQIKAAALIHPARLALSGRTMTPGLFEIMELLGSNTCSSRIEQAMNYIRKNNLQPEE